MSTGRADARDAALSGAVGWTLAPKGFPEAQRRKCGRSASVTLAGKARAGVVVVWAAGAASAAAGRAGPCVAPPGTTADGRAGRPLAASRRAGRLKVHYFKSESETRIQCCFQTKSK